MFLWSHPCSELKRIQKAEEVAAKKAAKAAAAAAKVAASSVSLTFKGYVTSTVPRAVRRSVESAAAAAAVAVELIVDDKATRDVLSCAELVLCTASDGVTLFDHEAIVGFLLAAGGVSTGSGAPDNQHWLEWYRRAARSAEPDFSPLTEKLAGQNTLSRLSFESNGHFFFCQMPVALTSSTLC